MTRTPPTLEDIVRQPDRISEVARDKVAGLLAEVERMRVALWSRLFDVAAKFKEPFLLLALDLLKRGTTPSPSASPPPNPANPATTPSQSGPSTSFVFVRPSSYRPTPGSYRPVVRKSGLRPQENR